MAACGGGSGGAILFLIDVVILLLFARPLLVGIVFTLFVARCSFCRLPLARLQRAMVGCCLLLSAALFVIACCPAIIDDCVAGRQPPAAGASRCSCVAGGQRLSRSLDAVVLVNGKNIGLEVDGPHHFVGKQPTGSTILKHRQVVAIDRIPLVSLPYWELNDLKQSEGKQQYLRTKLGLDRNVIIHA